LVSLAGWCLRTGDSQRAARPSDLAAEFRRQFYLALPHSSQHSLTRNRIASSKYPKQSTSHSIVVVIARKIVCDDTSMRRATTTSLNNFKYQRTCNWRNKS
jgi:hypothetical protein